MKNKQYFIGILGISLVLILLCGCISSTPNTQSPSSLSTATTLITTSATKSPIPDTPTTDDAYFAEMIEGELLFIEEDLQNLNNAINARDYKSIEYYSKVLQRKTKGSKDIANSFKISSQNIQLKSDFFAFLDEVDMMAISAENGAILAQKGQLSSAGKDFNDAANHARNIQEIYLPRLERQLR